ncbi:MAG: hypothetical protein ABJO36_00055 [Litorimonas sp.]
MIHLDAEELAEQGLATFYDFIQPELSKFIAAPNPLTEIRDENDFYFVESGGYVWPIVDETSMTSGDVWLNAAFAFFEMVNQQLRDTDYKLYAFYAGNDLSGMFLTEEEAEQSMAKLPSKADWPYLVTLEPEYNGRYHD